MKGKVFTKKQIKEYEKKENCKVIHITVFKDQKSDFPPEQRDRVECLLKDPLSFSNLGFISSLIDLDTNLSRGEYMLDNLWIDGDPDFLYETEGGESTGRLNNTHVRYTAALTAMAQVRSLEAETVKH